MSQTPGGFPEPGEMFGPYRVVRRLGFGGMGVVFEAMDGTLNRPVALKVISSHLAEDPGFRARFVREAQAQASVRSPHVVTVHSFGEAEGRLYIATELVDAGDLGRLVHEHGAPPLATALDIIAQVASGLADAHAAGLVHRDIKPANVLLRHREHGVQAYLADFGIARQVGAELTGLTVVGGTVGTPSYMAPELHTGAQAGVESDIYSLGCLLWAAITGTAPFTGLSDYQIVSAHLEQPVPQLRPGTPAADAVNRVLVRSLAKLPGDRYAGAAAMSRDLRAAASLAEHSGEAAVPALGAQAGVAPPTRPGTPVGHRPTPTPTPGPPIAHPPTPTPTPTPHADRRKRRVGVVVAAVVLVLAAGIGAAFALTSDDDPSASPDPDPSSPTTSEPTEPTDPTEPTTSSDHTDADERRAVASMTQAVVAAGMINEELGGCVAQGWIDGVGLDTMIEAGFFDEDLNYVDQPKESITAEMQNVLTRVIADCSVSGLESP
jgi:serine/threonine protein kinase